MMRIELPSHLKTLAKVNDEILLDMDSNASISQVLDQLESKFPALLGTIRDQITKKHRPLIRFFGCKKDFTFYDPFKPLPEEITQGKEALLIIGAIAGG